MGKPLYEYNKDTLVELSSLTSSVLKEKNRVVICIIGKKGSGKSGFGRYLRKKGILGISKRKLAIIDDGVLSIRLLWIFNRRVKNIFRQSKPDQLRPFLPYVKSCSIIVYVSSNPVERLSKTDIIINIKVNNKTRLERLIQRNGVKDGQKRYECSHQEFDVISLPHKYLLEMRTD